MYDCCCSNLVYIFQNLSKTTFFVLLFSSHAISCRISGHYIANIPPGLLHSMCRWSINTAIKRVIVTVIVACQYLELDSWRGLVESEVPCGQIEVMRVFCAEEYKFSSGRVGCAICLMLDPVGLDQIIDCHIHFMLRIIMNFHRDVGIDGVKPLL